MARKKKKARFCSHNLCCIRQRSGHNVLIFLILLFFFSPIIIYSGNLKELKKDLISLIIFQDSSLKDSFLYKSHTIRLDCFCCCKGEAKSLFYPDQMAVGSVFCWVCLALVFLYCSSGRFYSSPGSWLLKPAWLVSPVVSLWGCCDMPALLFWCNSALCYSLMGTEDCECVLWWWRAPLFGMARRHCWDDALPVAPEVERRCKMAWREIAATMHIVAD